MRRLSTLFKGTNIANGDDVSLAAQSLLHDHVVSSNGTNGIRGTASTSTDATSSGTRKLRLIKPRTAAAGPSYLQRLARWELEAPEGEAESRKKAVKKILPCARKRHPETVLFLENMGLTALPPLPPNLTNIVACKNRLTWLEPLPPGLLYLHVQDNCLTNLPEIPHGLLYLHADNNRLTSLPELPHTVTSLEVSNNRLSCVPALPPKLFCVNLAGNPLMNSLAEIVGTTVEDPARILEWQARHPHLVATREGALRRV